MNEKAFRKRLTAPTQVNGYYFNQNIFFKCGYGMPNCTCYAWGRWYELMGIKPKLYTGNAETWFPKGNEEKIVRRILEEIKDKGKDFNLAKFNDNLAKLISCKMSIKANTRITPEAQEEIINKLRKCDNPFNCPHGRPTIIHFTTYELEKMFKRSI